MFLKHLECSACGLHHDWSLLQNLCRSCHKPLLAIVDLTMAGRTLTRETLATREKSLWRYREVLPLPGDVEPVSLGEGGTPLLRASSSRRNDDIDLWIKDESLNPTQSFMPRDTPRANIIECRELGAHVTLIDGLITDCGAEIARRKEKEGWFDMSTLKEPYRIEGKKTLGYEMAEQLNWKLPDV